MEVTWLRPQFSSVVHLYREGKDQLGLQGRTELLKDNIQDGNVTLRILNIRPFDQGQYNCLVDDGTVSEQAVLELKVKGQLLVSLLFSDLFFFVSVYHLHMIP